MPPALPRKPLRPARAPHRLGTLGAAGCAAAVTLSLMTGCGSEDSTGNSPSRGRVPVVDVQPVTRGSIAATLETTGQTVATRTVTLRATVEGPISFCPWREGDRVTEPGQKMVEISRPLYEAELQMAQAALAVAEAKLADLLAGPRSEEIAQARESVTEYEACTQFAETEMRRRQSLAESGVLSLDEEERTVTEYVQCRSRLAAARERLAMLEAGPTESEIAVAEAQVEEARARLATAQAERDECVLTAPFAGIVTAVHVRPGDLATPQLPLLEIADLSSLVVRFAVPETASSAIERTRRVHVRFDALPGQTFSAEIVRVYPVLDQTTRTRTVEAAVEGDVSLLPGMFARVTVNLDETDEALVIPDSAVVTTPGGETVAFVVNGDTASMRVIETGVERDRQVQVLAGLSSGELVVVSGNERLVDGATVQVNRREGQPGSRGGQRAP